MCEVGLIVEDESRLRASVWLPRQKTGLWMMGEEDRKMSSWSCREVPAYRGFSGADRGEPSIYASTLGKCTDN